MPTLHDAKKLFIFSNTWTKKEKRKFKDEKIVVSKQSGKRRKLTKGITNKLKKKENKFNA